MLGLNAIFALSSAALGRRLDPISNHHFLIEIDGLLTGGFSQVEGLGGSIEVEPIHDGGSLGGARQQLGATTWDNIVLSHGVVEHDTLWNWYEATARGVIKRKNGSIVLLDRQKAPVTLWNFRAGIPVVWRGPTLDAGASEVAVERIEIAHHGLEKPNSIRALQQVRAMVRYATGKEGLW
ncbi:MAG TPA: phage tail protein [Nannocystis sp.]|jgi:phage tail-like protein